jgi:TatA/E family protein of Tat protein translocase
MSVEILGIGPMELVLILIVALMVFGPDRLPTIGSKLGRAMRDMRRATRAISEEINTTRSAIEAPAKELAEPFQDMASAAKNVSSVAAAARNPGEAIRQSVLKELNAPAKAEETATAPSESENTIAPPALFEGTPPERETVLTASEDTPAPTDALASITVDVPSETPALSETPAESGQVAPPPEESEPSSPSADAEPGVPEQ